MFDIFSDFFDNFNTWDGFDVFPHTVTEEKKCPKRGRTYREFSKYGKLGCADCYITFRPTVRQVLARTQKSAKHTGKVPSRACSELKRRQRYDELKSKIAEAVKNENYEEAARLHKEIRKMEQERGV